MAIDAPRLLAYLAIAMASALLAAVWYLVRIVQAKAPERLDISVALAPLNQGVTALQVELRGVMERVSGLEQRQGDAARSLGQMQTGLTHEATLTQSIASSTDFIRQHLANAQEVLGGLRAQSDERWRQLDITAASIQRVESVITGGRSKGQAGEYIVEQLLSALPPEWIARNFTVGNKQVEFALRLPTGQVVPIDSKWPATAALDELRTTTDPASRNRLRDQVERTVLQKALEVRVYIQPGLTESFCIAVVPDEVHAIAVRAQVETLQVGVAIVSYGLLLPYLLMVMNSAIRASATPDEALLSHHLHEAARAAQSVREEVEGRLSRTVVQLSNSRDELRRELDALGANLRAVRPGMVAVAASEGGSE